MAINISVQYNGGSLPDIILFKKNMNASKPSEHLPSGEKMFKGFWPRVTSIGEPI